MIESLDFIFKRRSIRKYTGQPISEDVLTLLLQAGMAAPTAMNARPWEFVVVTDGEIINQLRDNLVFGKHDPSAVIAVCGSTRFSTVKVEDRFWVQDCSAAMENILLASSALGLGSVWVGVHPVTLFVKRVSEVLNLPANITPLGLIYLGYPAEQKEARTQYDARKVHWQQYGSGKGGSD